VAKTLVQLVPLHVAFTSALIRFMSRSLRSFQMNLHSMNFQFYRQIFVKKIDLKDFAFD
jgi:hypothetical protein